MSEPALDSLVDQVVAGPVDMAYLNALAPFLGEQSLDRLVDRLIESGDPIHMEALASLAPHLSQGTLRKLLALAQEGTLDAHMIVRLAPFLDQETLESIIRSAMPRKGESAE
jgi:hypothetical protein